MRAVKERVRTVEKRTKLRSEALIRLLKEANGICIDDERMRMRAVQGRAQLQGREQSSGKQCNMPLLGTEQSSGKQGFEG